MKRRDFIVGLGMTAACPPVARAQQGAGRVYQIGYLASPVPSSATNSYLEAFRRRLRDLGWIEGQNVNITFRRAQGDVALLPRLAFELVQLKVDVILALGSLPALAAKDATKTIPIVFSSVGDPVGLGIVASLSRPGGNVTGLAYSVGLEIVGKQLEILKEAVPAVGRVAILSNAVNPVQPLVTEIVELASRTLGVQLQLVQVRAAEEFDDAFKAMAQQRASALLVLIDTLFISHRERLAQLAVAGRLPSMHGARELVEAGGLIHYGHDLREQHRQAATFVDKILRGSAPADLPVEQPTKFELVINLKTARALGLQVPPTLLSRADEVIE